MKNHIETVLAGLVLGVVLVLSSILVVSYPHSAQAGNNNYSSYADIPDNHWAFWYIEAAGKNDIIQGYSDNTFRPDYIVAKGEGTAFVIRAANVKPCCSPYFTQDCDPSAFCQTSYFQDVPPENSFYPYIQAAFYAGILNGTFSGNLFYTGGDTTEKLSQGVLQSWITNAIQTTATVPPSFSYDPNAQVTRAQAAALIAWNFNLPVSISGQSTRVVLDEDGEPVDTEEPLSGAIVKVWNDAAMASADGIVLADENGRYTVDLDIREVTNNLKIQSNDPEKYFPAVELNQQESRASRKTRSSSRAKTTRTGAGQTFWNLSHSKKSDCTKNFYERVVQIAGQEKQRWINYQEELERKHPDWTDQKIYDTVDSAVRMAYINRPKKSDWCCTGFVTYVLTKAGLVEKNGRSFFYTKATTLPLSDARMVGAVRLRGFFEENNDQKLVARDGNIYKIKLIPKQELFSDISQLKAGQIFMKLPLPGERDSGHSAIFYPEINLAAKTANSMNCDSPADYIGEWPRNLRDSSKGEFYGTGAFECIPSR